MGVSYEYQIANLDVGTVNGLDNVILAVHYRVVAYCSEVELNPVYSGVAKLGNPGDDFTVFDSLTRNQVEQWLKSAIDTEAIEADLARQVAELAKAQSEPQPQASKLPPWKAGAGAK